MGFWANQIRSIRKGSKLRRLSLVLGQLSNPYMAPKAINSIDMVVRIPNEWRRAKEELFDLIEDDPELRNVLVLNHATRDDLRILYDAIFENCGVWAKGHFIPASALAFVYPLDYILYSLKNQSSKETLNAIGEVCHYFDKGHMGSLR